MPFDVISRLRAQTWFSILKRSVRIGGSAALLVAAISIFLPNYYKSDARVLPGDASLSGTMGQLAAAAATFGVQVGGGGGGPDDSYQDILKSRWVGDNLLNTEFQFHVRSWRFGKERLIKQTLFEYMNMPNMDRAFGALDNMVTIVRDFKSRTYTISVETKSPELSQQVAQRLVKLLETFVIEKSSTKGGAKAAFAKERLVEARDEMAKAEDEYRRFFEANRNYQTSNEPSVRLLGGRLEMELRLRQQLYTTIAMNREQALLDEKNDVPILNVLDEGNLPIDKSRPSRGIMVISVFFLVSGGVWSWARRDWIKAHLFAASEG